MKLIKKIFVTYIIFVLITNFLFPRNVLCITIKEEEELSKEFMKMVQKHFKLIKDPFILNYVNAISDRIVSVLPPQPFPYQVHVIKEAAYNAFATPAGHVFINSGLIEAMESEEELAGIISHEISHIMCRHISHQIERSTKISLATLAGIAAAIFLGMSGAGSEAINAVSIGSVAAGQSLSLAYSREDEKEADQVGLKYLTKAGYSGAGLLKMLKKIRDKQWFGSDVIPTYLTTHPAVEERIAYISTFVEKRQKSANTQQPTATSQFQEVHTRVVAIYGNEEKALKYFKTKVAEKPDDLITHHGYGLVLERTGNRKEAILHLKAALEKRAFNPYILKDLGRVYFQDGKYTEALRALKGSVSLEANDPETFFYLGMTQMELKQWDEAIFAFKELTQKAPDYHRAFYYLGEAYGKKGNLGDAHYYLGKYHTERRDIKNAMFHLKRALNLTKDPDKKSEIEEMLKEIKKAEALQRREEKQKK